MTRRIGAGVIGAGFAGRIHARSVQLAGGRLVGIVGSSPERSEAIAGEFGEARAFTSPQELIADAAVEVVHVCTPNHLHGEFAEAALQAGKHVVCEKPLALDSPTAERLSSLAESSGLVATVPFVYRFYPLVRTARDRVRGGDLGVVRLVHGSYLQDWLMEVGDYNWRVDPLQGGRSRAFADIGSHWCDLVQFVSGRRIIRVCADLVTFHPKRKKPRTAVETFKGKEQHAAKAALSVPVSTEDAGIVMFQLDNGGRGVFTVSQVSAGRKNREWFEIDGSKKAIAWDQEEPNQLWIGYREKANELLAKDPSLLHEDIRRYAHYPGGHPEGYPDGPKNLFINFYTSLREGKDPRKEPADYPTFADGHWEICLVEAILKSSRQRRWVDVTAVR